jgi:hypothetical protein
VRGELCWLAAPAAERAAEQADSPSSCWIPLAPFRRSPEYARTCCISLSRPTILMRQTTPASSALPRPDSFSRCTSSISTSDICGRAAALRGQRWGITGRQPPWRADATRQPSPATPAAHLAEEPGIAKLLVLAGDGVELLGRGADEVGGVQVLRRGLHVAAELHHAEAQHARKPAARQQEGRWRGGAQLSALAAGAGLRLGTMMPVDGPHQAGRAPRPHLSCQLLTRSCTSARIGARYTTLVAPPGGLKPPSGPMCLLISRRTASSMTPVLPEPVGAASTCGARVQAGHQSRGDEWWHDHRASVIARPQRGSAAGDAPQHSQAAPTRLASDS